MTCEVLLLKQYSKEYEEEFTARQMRVSFKEVIQIQPIQHIIDCMAKQSSYYNSSGNNIAYGLIDREKEFDAIIFTSSNAITSLVGAITKFKENINENENESDVLLNIEEKWKKKKVFLLGKKTHKVAVENKFVNIILTNGRNNDNNSNNKNTNNSTTNTNNILKNAGELADFIINHYNDYSDNACSDAKILFPCSSKSMKTISTKLCEYRNSLISINNSNSANGNSNKYYCPELISIKIYDTITLEFPFSALDDISRQTYTDNYNNIRKWIVFFSPSGVDSLLKHEPSINNEKLCMLVANMIATFNIAAIGKTTANAINSTLSKLLDNKNNNNNCYVKVVSPLPTAHALAQAIAQHNVT